MIEELSKYAKGIDASDEVMTWLGTAGKKALGAKKINQSEMEHILDYLVSADAPRRLLKMSVSDAKRKAREWSERNQKKGKDLVDGLGDTELIHDFGDGTKIVKLKSKRALQREGFLMSHCVGGYSISDTQLIYSYRDKKNMPHATFEVQKDDNEIVQVKGKGNGPIHPKYIYPILAFLKSIGMDIRPRDMVNLGYYHIHKEHIEFLKTMSGAADQLAEINGEWYAK